MDRTWTELLELDDVEVKISFDLSKHTTMRLQGKGNLIIVSSIDSLKTVVQKLKEGKIAYTLLGWGANSLISDHGEETFIQLKLPFDENILTEVRDTYYLPASLSVSLMTRAASNLGLKGWECLTGIPASLGGAIFMNAGTKFGEIKDIINSVDVMNSSGEIRTVQNSDEIFSYRKNHFVKKGDVIIGAEVRHGGVSPEVSETIKSYMKYRKDTQPLATKNCGCVFKNLDLGGAGLIIDTLGLKGFEYKCLKVSEKHANFIENHGESNLSDFNELVTRIKNTVLLYTGKRIECEVQYNYTKEND